MGQQPPDFMSHRESDDVAVAVRDVEPGAATVGNLENDNRGPLEVRVPIPLGHKVALRPVEAGADVVEYGLRIGHATAAIRPGEHVHVHNVRSARWQASTV